MTGRWVLDDGQSLCYIESDNSENETSTFLQQCVAAGLDGLPLLESEQPTRNFHFTAPESCSTSNVPTGCSIFDHSFPDAGQSLAETCLDSIAQHDSDPIAHLNCSSVPTGLKYLTCFDDTSNISVLAGVSCKRKRVAENYCEQHIDTIRPNSRKRQSSQRQATIQPSVKVNVLDQNLWSPLANMKLVMGFNTRLPISRFDGYIHALRQLIRCSAEASALANNLKRALTAEGVLWVVRESWPAAEGYWNLTATFKGFLHAELWRNFPCERTYRQLPPEYRPTRAQLMIPHSPMIDWMPWPDLRDLAIRHQDQIDTDELFRMAILNVVAHRKNLPGSPPPCFPSPLDKKSFRVWDLVCLEKSNGVNPLADPGLTRKPVLHSPSARALVRAFDLEYDEFATQKLDNDFFEAYPTLYCDTAASSWVVEDFQAILPEDVGYPVDLSSSAVHRLKSKFECMIGSVIRV